MEGLQGMWNVNKAVTKSEVVIPVPEPTGEASTVQVILPEHQRAGNRQDLK